MQFSTLLAESGLPVRTRRGEVGISSVCFDSRRCGPGACFVAVRGVHQDGHHFLADALARGASAVICEDASQVPEEIPHAVFDDTQSALGPLAQAMFGWPARKLAVAAVTGTNGKTTVASLTHALLNHAGHKAALLGTIAYRTGQRSEPAGMTTPDPVRLAEMMDEMVRSGMEYLVMEASSHALHQKRTAGIDFRVAVFTNLSGDHLDYHRTMEDYLAAKRLLFEQLPPDATAVVNRDDPAGEAMAVAAPADVLWYGLNPLADLRGRIETINAEGSEFDLIAEELQRRVRTSLIGRHNVYNALAALGACRALGMDLETAAEALGEIHRVPGRLERVPGDQPFGVFVDYAHTDDALANVLGALRPITDGRIILVFGCGGDRDKSKRPRMARVAEEMSEQVIVTSDNPRSEQPEAIIEDILAGFDAASRGRVIVLPDRGEAIARAVELAHPGDAVLIAGKGHETYQVIGDHRIDFDDVRVAGRALAQRKEVRA